MLRVQALRHGVFERIGFLVSAHVGVRIVKHVDGGIDMLEVLSIGRDAMHRRANT
jgi:hypothetical protein